MRKGTVGFHKLRGISGLPATWLAGATAGFRGKNGRQRCGHPRQPNFRAGSRREVDVTEITL
jgi:hypothetical protein